MHQELWGNCRYNHSTGSDTGTFFRSSSLPNIYKWSCKTYSRSDWFHEITCIRMIQKLASCLSIAQNGKLESWTSKLFSELLKIQKYFDSTPINRNIARRNVVTIEIWYLFFGEVFHNSIAEKTCMTNWNFANS